ncbi:MAG: hypothetical protein ACP5OU_03925, partial [Methanothrix sp.]
MWAADLVKITINNISIIYKIIDVISISLMALAIILMKTRSTCLPVNESTVCCVQFAKRSGSVMPAMAVRFIKARIEKGYLNVSESHQDNSLQPKLVGMKAITGISILEIIDGVKILRNGMRTIKKQDSGDKIVGAIIVRHMGCAATQNPVAAVFPCPLSIYFGLCLNEVISAIPGPGPAICIVIGRSCPSIDVGCIPGIIHNRIVVVAICGINHRGCIVGRIGVCICWIPIIIVAGIIPGAIRIVSSWVKPVVVIAETIVTSGMTIMASKIRATIMIPRSITKG